MKKYITPKMECAAFVNGGILCHSQDGEGAKYAPTDSKTPGTGNAAPKRPF